MRDDVKRKLDAQISRERWMRIAPIVLAGLLLVATAYIYRPPVEKIVHTDAELTWSTTRIQSMTGRPYLEMRAVLDGGREISVESRLQAKAPLVGSKIRVVEEKSWLGFSTFIWDHRK